MTMKQNKQKISLCKKCRIELDGEVPIIYGNKILLCPECFKKLLISKVLKAKERSGIK